MNVTKLTITPWCSKGATQVFEKPSINMSATLIKERLSVAPREDKPARIFRKIPKILKGFVNPECKVSNERKFSMDI